ncbi:hypothetical protein [Aquimarina sp. MMG016]|uniref:hypothetical protein n=1 Tax=Aquimarina sp. MMG016 TaxID=2822690 RepID=UPI001B3A44ED|nr:hypothetical protein [Aquimarina sp. MMG016]MBQ4821672.1 hypothetical protein [Aquimarina sp. MMG016]
MKINLKNIISFLLCTSVLTLGYSQNKTLVEGTSEAIGKDLDLEAVAVLFGESKNLEDFEKKLNSPETKISNLDLNNDGAVDYLRVVDTSQKDTHLITVQAAVAKDTFQDVAVINVEKDPTGTTKVVITGNVKLYGPDYVIIPTYKTSPIIITWFWGPAYRLWVSPYYYRYYPNYYRPWPTYTTTRYRTAVRRNVNVRTTTFRGPYSTRRVRVRY